MSHHPSILDTILTRIQHKWGHKSIYRASQMEPRPMVLPTGVDELTQLLSGGLLQGQITQYIGRPTSGMSTLAYQQIVEAQSQQNHVIYLDLSASLDAEYAASCGVDLDDLLIVQPPNTVTALKLTRDIILCGLVTLLIINAEELSPGVPFGRLQPYLNRTQMVILLLSRKPFTAIGTIVNITCQNWLREIDDVTGCQIQATLLKHPTLSTGSMTQFNLPFPIGGDHA